MPHKSGSSDEGKKHSSKKMKVEIDHGMLVIRLPIETARESGSGKTMVIASTHGNIDAGVEVEGKPIRIGVNAYYYAKDKRK